MVCHIPKTWLLFITACIFFVANPFSLCSALAATPTAVLSGNTLTLSDNSTVKLEGIEAPLPETEALAEQARAMLEKLTAGKELILEHSSMDRYGQITAQVFIAQDDGTRVWLQEVMLREGLAFIYPPTGEEPGLDVLFAAETEARAARRGIWADAFYADTPDTKAWRKYGHFAFVSGTVLKAERVKEKIYLNFGADWHKDFTVAIAAHDLTFFRKAGIDPLAYESKIIRVRGWVNRNFGPMITVTTPMQIEIIGSP